jgi:hypothetical protein
VGETPRRLGIGLHVGNLWRCNWSDPNDCRDTGMSRFGTYWVEGGRLMDPLNVMRFDDSLYQRLGGRPAGEVQQRRPGVLLDGQSIDPDSAMTPYGLVAGDWVGYHAKSSAGEGRFGAWDVAVACDKAALCHEWGRG